MFRYFPAYLVEYAKVYEDLLLKDFLNGELNIIMAASRTGSPVTGSAGQGVP